MVHRRYDRVFTARVPVHHFKARVTARQRVPGYAATDDESRLHA